MMKLLVIALAIVGAFGEGEVCQMTANPPTCNVAGGEVCFPDDPLNNPLGPGKCKGSGSGFTCTPACATDEVCFGTCIKIDAGAGLACKATDPKCPTGFACTSDNICFPSADAGTCTPACESGFDCYYGFCAPGKNTPCTPACTGGTCTYGFCVPNAPTCVSACATNEFCVDDGTGAKCINPFAPCSPACTGTDLCIDGTCTTCPSCPTSASVEFSAALQAAYGENFDAWASAGVAAQVKTADAVAIAADLLTTISNTGQFTVAALNFAAARASVAFEAAAQATVAAVTAAENAALILKAKAEVTVTKCTAEAGKAVTFSLEKGAAATDKAKAILSEIDIKAKGQLTFSGSGDVTFPSDGTKVTTATGASVKLAGGAQVQGNVGSANVIVGGVNGQKAAFTVSNAGTFTTKGNVLGAGTIDVKGNFDFQGSVIQGDIDIRGEGETGSKGNLEIKSPKFDGGKLTLAMQGQMTISKPGALIKFKELAQCAANAVITLKVDNFASIKSGDQVGFKYDAKGAVASCPVVLEDKDGNTVTLIEEGSVTAGRRLLAAGSGTYSYDNNQMTYTYANANAAGNLQSSVVVVLGAVLFAFLARLF